MNNVDMNDFLKSPEFLPPGYVLHIDLECGYYRLVNKFSRLVIRIPFQFRESRLDLSFSGRAEGLYRGGFSRSLYS